MSTSDSIPGEDSAPPSDVSMHLAYAEACVVMVECLMHVMVERKLIPKEDLVAAVENAINTKKEMSSTGGIKKHLKGSGLNFQTTFSGFRIPFPAILTKLGITIF